MRLLRVFTNFAPPPLVAYNLLFEYSVVGSLEIWSRFNLNNKAPRDLN